MDSQATYASGVLPKIELHVHLEGTIRVRRVYEAAALGVLCDDATRNRITAVGEQTTWPG